MKITFDVLFSLLLSSLFCVIETHARWRYQAFSPWYRSQTQCDPCLTKTCGSQQKCFLVYEEGCAFPPCSVKPTCIVDPSLDLCPLGTPMSDNTGRHMSCVTSSNCPTDSKCVKSTVEGVEIGKCCLDESKCSNKAGMCPLWTASSTCSGSCSDDGDCPDVSKCCATACAVPGKHCAMPHPWFNYFYRY